MLVIRFLRTGKKNQPSFKIVVVEKEKTSTSGLFKEEVGFYNPLTKEKVLKAERFKYWISVGAKPSPRVHNLLISEKIIEGKKIDVHKKAKEKAGTLTEAPVAGTPQSETLQEVPAAESLKEEAPKEQLASPEKTVIAEVPQEEKVESEEKKEEVEQTE